MVALGLQHVLAGALDVLATEGGVVEYLLAVGTRAALKIVKIRYYRSHYLEYPVAGSFWAREGNNYQVNNSPPFSTENK